MSIRHGQRNHAHFPTLIASGRGFYSLAVSVFAALILFAGWSAVEHDCRHHDHNNCPICVFGANPAEETQITVWVVTPSQAYLEPVYVLPDPESVFPSAFLPRAPPAY